MQAGIIRFSRQTGGHKVQRLAWSVTFTPPTAPHALDHGTVLKLGVGKGCGGKVWKILKLNFSFIG